MENSFKSQVDSSKSILILIPSKPYFDQVAASLALKLSLGKKQVEVVSSTQMLVQFNQLVGVNKIVSEIGNKNLNISFSGYKANDIERISYDIENEEFRLSIVPKPGVMPPKKEQVRLEFSGVSVDLIVLIGGRNESHFPFLSNESLKTVKIVHIGTRALATQKYTQTMSFARPASCVSEIVATLIKESDLILDVDIATNLLMGIEEGSNRFSNSEVSAETFQCVSDLMRVGGKRMGNTAKQASPPQISNRVEPDEPPQAPKVQEPPKEWLTPKIYKGSTVS